MAASIAKPHSPIPVTRKGRKKRVFAKVDEVIKTTLTNPALSHQDIATLHDIERSTVSKILARYSIDHTQVKDFRDNRGDILAGLQHRIVTSITDADIQKAPMGSRVLAVAQLYDKERLERDLSTANLASVHSDIAELRKAVDK
jgi:hypothetical protein